MRRVHQTVCPSPCDKLTRRAKFRFTETPKSVAYLRPSRSGKRGGRASSRTRDGMWWTRERRRASAVAGRVEPRERSTGAQDERRLSVRQNRVVLTPVAGAKSAVANQTRPGLRRRKNPPTTVTRRIRRRGEHGISRKAITQGMPDASAEPVCSCAHPLSIAHETAGAARIRHFLRP